MKAPSPNQLAWLLLSESLKQCWHCNIFTGWKQSGDWIIAQHSEAMGHERDTNIEDEAWEYQLNCNMFTKWKDRRDCLIRQHSEIAGFEWNDPLRDEAPSAGSSCYIFKRPVHNLT